MLGNVLKKNVGIFQETNVLAVVSNLNIQKRKAARELGNPRLLKIAREKSEFLGIGVLFSKPLG
jgi:hypothetical protein